MSNYEYFLTLTDNREIENKPLHTDYKEDIAEPKRFFV